MILKKNLKGGVLLYALLMSAVLSLLLSFYTHRLQASYRVYREQILSQQASFLAEFAKSLATDEDGEIFFDKGRVVYQNRGDCLEIAVTIGSKIYRYTFLKNSATESESKEMKEGDNKKVKKKRENKNSESDDAEESKRLTSNS